MLSTYIFYFICRLEIMNIYKTVSGAFFSTVLVTSILLNMTACYIILIKVKRKELTHLFIISISVTNLLESVLGIIPQIVMSAESLFERTNLCITSGFAVFGFAITNIAHLSVLSLIRTVAIKYPIFYFKNCKKFWCRVTLISVCYAYGFTWATLPLIGWSKYEIDLDKKRCSLDWRLTRSDSLSYIVTVFIFCNILPGILIALALYVSVNAVAHRKVCELRLTKKIRSIDLLEKDYLRVCSLSTIMFFVIWTPYAVVGILALFKIVPPTLLVMIAAMFAKLSTISNVLINCFINKSFKNHLLKLRLIRLFTYQRPEFPRIDI